MEAANADGCKGWIMKVEGRAHSGRAFCFGSMGAKKR
jgi:hypothetical protein